MQKLGKDVTQWSISHGPSDTTCEGAEKIVNAVEQPLCVGSMATRSTVNILFAFCPS